MDQHKAAIRSPQYDATLKKLFQRPPNRLLSFALGVEVKAERLLPTELISVQNLHPDLLFESTTGELIHVELQGYPQAEFACRNLLYYGLILRDYQRPPRQVVFWVGDGAVGISQGLAHEGLDYRYKVLDVRAIDPAFLLASDEPGDWIFAILCKLRDKRQAVTEIVQRIAKLDPARRRDAAAQLLILSGLRNLTSAVQQEVTRMPITIDIEKNQFLQEIYQRGEQQGEQKGRAEGEQKGRAEGEQKGRAEGVQIGARQALISILVELAQQRFPSIPPSWHSRIEASTLDQIRSAIRRCPSAASLDELFD